MHRLRRLVDYLKTLNLFDDDTDDEYKKRNQILSTRLYIILFIIILAVFTLYISLSPQTTTIIISKPTQDQYEELEIKFSNTLKCPCKDISITYENFIDIKPIYHEICSSDFISQHWIDFLFEENMTYYFQLDFRRSAIAQFQILHTLCQQAQQTINDSLIEFYSIQLITPQLISNTTFIIQINSSLEIFKQRIQLSFQNLIKLFRSVVINNQLLSAHDTTNAIVNSNPDDPPPTWMSHVAIQYYELSNQSFILNCHGSDGKISKLPGGIYANINRYDYPGSIWYDTTRINSTTSNITATLLLPGIFIGCLPIESLLQSTTECFFNETCLNIITSYRNHSIISSNSFSVLNKSRFLPETTIETLMNELFIEEWIVNTLYIQYFNQCQPSFCQYSKEEKNTIVYVITIMISLYGGLKVVLSFLVPTFITFIRKKKQQQQQQVSTIDNTSPNIPVKVHLYSLLQNSIRSVLKFNIFDSRSTDQRVKKNEVISTRIYFIVSSCLLVIFTLYISLTKHTKIITVDNPTQIQFEYLSNSFINDLQCPCNQISIRYDKFIMFQPAFHQICSSIIVSGLWQDETYWMSYFAHPYDFQRRSADHFGLLSTFCQFTNVTVMNSLTQFYANEYITSQVITSDIFNDQIISFIELFQLTTQQSFEQTLGIFRNMIFDNLLTSAIFSNADFYIHTSTGYPIVRPSIIDFDGCSCTTDITCRRRSDIQPDFSMRFNEFPDIYIACSIIESVLYSTVECFYDEDCILRMKNYMYPYSTLYKILEAIPLPKKSQYQTNTSIGTIVNNLFIEDWNVNYSYEKYYDQCKPSYCSYTLQQRPEFFYVLLKLISIFGGLSIVVKFLVPIIVNKIRREKRQQQQQQQPVIPILEQIRHILKLSKQNILNLNLFKTNSNNNIVIRRQQLTTKFYLIILLISLIILILYTSLNQISVTDTIQLTSENQYENLAIKYPNTLSCPCNQISIEYQKFIQIGQLYHQICSSVFVSQDWINYLYLYDTRNEQNFRATAAAQFLILSSLCRLTKNTVETNIQQFYGTKFLTSQLISSDLFETQINSFINSFRISIPRTFKRTLDTTRGLIHGNSLLSGYETSWKFLMIGVYYYAPMYTKPQSYDDSCNCATSVKCTQPAIITDQYPSGLPGLLIGCYPLEAILRSSLECLYSETCLDLMILYMNNRTSSNTTIKIIDSSLLNGYNINETVEEIVDRLFIDKWYINKSYDKYYKQCDATYCTYSYIQNFDIFYILTTILGLYGGLSTVLQMVVPMIIYFILSILNQRTTRVVPFTEPENNIQQS